MKCTCSAYFIRAEGLFNWGLALHRPGGAYVPSPQTLHEPTAHLLSPKEPWLHKEVGSFPSPILRTPNFQQILGNKGVNRDPASSPSYAREASPWQAAES
jgi:hypothetical protein